MSDLRHAENITRIPFVGKSVVKRLERYIAELDTATEKLPDPNLSVVIRTKNDMRYLPGLLDDIDAQEYSGSTEVILVDTESSDGTVEYARKRGCQVVPVSQAEFSYPKALNLGYEAAHNPYVLSVVGHTALTSTRMFKALTLWHDTPNFGGVYGFTLPNWNASRSERWWALTWAPKLSKSFRIETEPHMGQLGANASFVSRAVWEELGRYDESYAAGGEDSALGRKMLEAGKVIISDPASFVYHSHALGPIDSMRQSWHWLEVYRHPKAFHNEQYLSRRPDMRKKHVE